MYSGKAFNGQRNDFAMANVQQSAFTGRSQNSSETHPFFRRNVEPRAAAAAATSYQLVASSQQQQQHTKAQSVQNTT